MLLARHHGRYALRVRHYDVTLPALPACNPARRIGTVVHLSDLHDAAESVRGGLDAIVSEVAGADPDLIAFTGDLFDRRDGDASPALAFLRRLSAIAPTFVVSGNHDRNPIDPSGRQLTFEEVRRMATSRPDRVLSMTSMWAERVGEIEATGATPLDDGVRTLALRGVKVVLCGARDAWPLVPACPERWSSSLERLAEGAALACEPGGQGATFTTVTKPVLLTHRPEHAELYARLGFGLALAGHTHGGQVRLPLIGALRVPNQRRRPRYDLGEFDVPAKRARQDGADPGRGSAMTLIVSSGLGCSELPRINCPPEVGVVALWAGSPSRPS
jgi:predicted MPP superfamily phosphohydrolase